MSAMQFEPKAQRLRPPHCSRVSLAPASHSQTVGYDTAERPVGKPMIDRSGTAYYTKTPGTHQITNLEKDKAMRLLAVGIVYPEPGRYTVSTRPPKYEVALDNDRVRAWRLKLNPGESRSLKFASSAAAAQFAAIAASVSLSSACAIAMIATSAIMLEVLVMLIVSPSFSFVDVTFWRSLYSSTPNTITLRGFN